MRYPLYLYPETTEKLELVNQEEQISNVKQEIVNLIAEELGLRFTKEKETSTDLTITTFALTDILDYNYAVLHSLKYRKTYREFLKIDFQSMRSRLTKQSFGDGELGGQLHQLHLLESEMVDNQVTTYPEKGNNVVVKPRFELAGRWCYHRQGVY